MSVTRLILEEEQERVRAEILEKVVLSDQPGDALKVVNVYVRDGKLVVEYEVPEEGG